MRKRIKLTEGDVQKMIRHAVTESVRKMISEAENGGWVVETNEAMDAYELACDRLGKETVDDAIVRSLGTEQLAESLAYIFRMYDFREWGERFGDE